IRRWMISAIHVPPPIRLLLSLSADDAQQVFVQLEPDRMVALDPNVADPFDVAILRLFQGLAQAVPIIGKTRNRRSERRQDRKDPVIDVAQPIDDSVVISRVLVIVGKPTTTDVHALPVGDDRLELNVYSFERLVAAHEVGVSTYCGIVARIVAFERYRSERA